MCMACPRSRRRACGIPLRFDSGGGALDTRTPRCSSLRSRQERFTELREEAIRTIASISYKETCRSKLYQTCDAGAAVRGFRECLQGGTVQEQREVVRFLVDHAAVLGGRSGGPLEDASALLGRSCAVRDH